MKSLYIKIITIAGALAAVVFLLMINEIMISIRLNELRAYLQEIDRREGSIDNIGLVATYELHKKLFENRISQDEADAREHQFISLAAREMNKPDRINAAFALLSLPALAVINFNRMVLGKAPLAFYPGDDPGQVDIDLAYYHERNLQFKRAIELYDASLGRASLNSSLRAGVILHKGYCQALLGSNQEARRSYLTVINKYGYESSAITATILLGYLEGFRLARERVLQRSDNPLMLGQNLVNLMAYRQAYTVLKDAELKAGPGDLPRIRYFMARCHAGMGETGLAVREYLSVITTSPASRYAVLSNRRLLITASSLEDNKLRNVSIKLNRIMKDPVLDTMIRDRKVSRMSPAAAKNTVKIDIPPDIKTTVDNLTAHADETSLKKDGYVVIFTSDGSVFRGTMIEETGGSIAIMTSIGRISIKKDRIKKITR